MAQTCTSARMLCASGTCFPTNSQLPVSRPSAFVRTPVAWAIADGDGNGLTENAGVTVGVDSARVVGLADGAGVSEPTEPTGVGAQLTIAPTTTARSVRCIARMMQAGLGVRLGGRAKDRDRNQSDREGGRTERGPDADHLRHAAVRLISHQGAVASELQDEDEHDG